MKKALFSLLLVVATCSMALAQENGSRTIVTDTAVCGEYTWSVNGVTYTTDTAVLYVDTANTLHVLNLTIDNPIHIDETLAYDRCSYNWHGRTLIEDGSYFDTIASTTGACDSLFSLQLTLTETETDEFDATACGSYEWFDSTYTTSGVFTHVDTTGGCTHTDVLNLNLTTRLNEFDTASNCGDYTWHGQAYTATGLYLDSVINGICDTIFHLNLTIVHDSMGLDSNAACNAYNWHGQRYTTSGIHFYNDTNRTTHCVKVYSLNLTIKPYREVEFDTSVSSCSSVRFSFNGEPRTFTRSVDLDTHFFDNHWDVCRDSLLHLHVTVRSHSTSDTTAVACDRFFWDRNQNTYTADAEPKYRLPNITNAVGCDSSIILHLTIKRSPVITAINGDWNLEAGDTAVFFPTGSANATYTWSTTPAAQTATDGDTLYVYNVQGNIDVTALATLTYSDIACHDTSWITIVTYVGIDGSDVANVSLYPNPAVGQLNIECSEAIREVAIFNTLGQQVALHSNLGTKSLINLSDLSLGTYTMRISLNNGETVIRKFVLTK